MVDKFTFICIYLLIIFYEISIIMIKKNIIFALIFTSISINGQIIKFIKMTNQKKYLIKEYLISEYDKNIYTEKFCFVELPFSNEPEYSLRLFFSEKDGYTLNYVTFKSSLSDQLINKFIFKEKNKLTIETKKYILPISKEIGEKLREIIKIIEESKINNEISLDDKKYWIRLYNKKRFTKLYIHEFNSYCLKFIDLISKLVKDIKNNEYSENNLIRDINNLK